MKLAWSFLAGLLLGLGAMWAGTASYSAARHREPVQSALWGLWGDHGDARKQLLILDNRAASLDSGEILLETVGEAWKSGDQFCVETRNDEGGSHVDCSTYELKENGKELRLGQTFYGNILGRPPVTWRAGASLAERIKAGRMSFEASMREYAGELESPRPDTMDLASLDQAIANYAAAVALAPSSSKALDGLAGCLHHRGDAHEGRDRSNLYRIAKLLVTLELEGEVRPFARRTLMEHSKQLDQLLQRRDIATGK